MVVYKDWKQPTGLSGDALAGLGQRLQGPLITPVDADYEVARRAWNYSVDRFPGAVARCVDATDVAVGPP
jgi:hypothetical protein